MALPLKLLQVDKWKVKPQRTRCGFTAFFLAGALSATAGQTPAGLAGELLWDASLKAAPVPEREDTAVRDNRIYVQGVYHDVLHRIVKEGSGTVLDRTEAGSSRVRAGIAVERKKWGACAGVRTGTIWTRVSGKDLDYAVDAHIPLSSLSVGGWAANSYGRLSARFGYDAGLPLDYRGFSNSSLVDSIGNVFKDPRFARHLALTLYKRNLSLTMYEIKRPLVNASARVERISNGAFVEIPLSAVTREAGAEARISAGRCFSTFGFSLASMSSDTALSGENVLPASIAGNGRKYRFHVSLDEVRFSPSAETNIMSHLLKIRGYDYTDTSEYCWLDSSRLFIVNYRVAAGLPWRVRAGLFGEFLRCASKKAGRFDPYVFSAFTFFNPEVYRLDTAEMRYHAIGLFGERIFGPFRRGSAVAALAVSYVRARGFLNTRQYDFIVWALVNPQSFPFLDEKLLLFAPEAGYSFPYGPFTCTITLRQLAPVSLKGGGAAEQPQVQSTVASVRGGTTVRAMIEYRW